MNYVKSMGILSVVLLMLSSCTIVRQGEVGVKRTLGRYSDKPYYQGLKWYNPFVASIVRLNTQTNNLEVALDLPSKEGLTIRSDVSILYNVEPKAAPEILRNLGPNYEQTLILPVFRSSVADVTSKFFAKDMHSGERGIIERAIRELMMTHLKGKGIEIEQVLLKSIQLPRSLSAAIEEKLASEQQAQRMEFILQTERKDAERKIISATGTRDAQQIISQGLDPMILRFKALEAFLELAKSNNAKVIITDSKSPLMMDASELINETGKKN
jgi:prohibitin 1